MKRIICDICCNVCSSDKHFLEFDLNPESHLDLCVICYNNLFKKICKMKEEKNI